MILLDTNALLWLERDHPRSRPLTNFEGRLYVSPATLLEMQFLVEVGKIRLQGKHTIASIADSPRWLVDDPPAAAWFHEAHDIPWTRDPFDRLIVAHAKRRGWRLATGDTMLLEHLTARSVVEL